MPIFESEEKLFEFDFEKEEMRQLCSMRPPSLYFRERLNYYDGGFELF
jgi:hypothetical protein